MVIISWILLHLMSVGLHLPGVFFGALFIFWRLCSERNMNYERRSSVSRTQLHNNNRMNFRQYPHIPISICICLSTARFLFRTSGHKTNYNPHSLANVLKVQRVRFSAFIASKAWKTRRKISLSESHSSGQPLILEHLVFIIGTWLSNFIVLPLNNAFLVDNC